MPIFKVKAYDSKGDLKSLRKDSSTEEELLRALSLEGYVPISVEAEKAKKSPDRAPKTLRLADQHLFCTMLSAFLQSGLSMTEVLRLLQRQTRDKRLQPIFSELRESVESGRSLAQSMSQQGVFRDSLVGMVEAGERSSSLPGVLDKASALLHGEIALRRRIQTALTYPLLMMVVGCFVAAFLLVYVVPQLTGIVTQSGQALPLATRMLLALSSAVKVGGIPVLIALLFAYVRMKRKGRRISLPLFSETRNLLTISLLFSQLSTLIKSGVPLVQALEMSGTLDPMPGRVKFLADEVRKGYRFSQSLERHGSFSEDVVSIVRIGEVGGNLPDCLDRIATNSWEFAQASMEKWSTLAEPLIIIVLGTFVGFVVMAVLLPIFSLSDLAGI
ncbi:MAG: type II secretion system F family protein [Synergistaceae bacterium]|jgi:type II secretory pathway component PulF|nr:type II secretion system F family protein [Synergistaceae bacterium]